MSYPSVPFGQHMEDLKWSQGDHVLLAAPTKCGKSTLAARLVTRRSHVVSFVCKLRDDTMDNEYRGWRRYERWPKHVPSYDQRILLWPKPERTLAATRAKQRFIFREALDSIQREGRRTIVIDEGLYMCESKMLNLGDEIGMLFYFGRSAGITMVMLSQRPAWIPKVVYSSSTHAWIARTRDKQDLQRLSDFGGIDAVEIGSALKTLPRRHDFLYLNPQGDAQPAVINTRR
jgi:hypothetical protein